MSSIDYLVSPESQTEEVLQVTVADEVPRPERQFTRDQTVGEVIDKMRTDECTEATITITTQEVT